MWMRARRVLAAVLAKAAAIYKLQYSSTSSTKTSKLTLLIVRGSPELRQEGKQAGSQNMVPGPPTCIPRA